MNDDTSSIRTVLLQASSTAVHVWRAGEGTHRMTWDELVKASVSCPVSKRILLAALDARIHPPTIPVIVGKVVGR